MTETAMLEAYNKALKEHLMTPVGTYQQIPPWIRRAMYFAAESADKSSHPETLNPNNRMGL